MTDEFQYPLMDRLGLRELVAFAVADDELAFQYPLMDRLGLRGRARARSVYAIDSFSIL